MVAATQLVETGLPASRIARVSRASDRRSECDELAGKTTDDLVTRLEHSLWENLPFVRWQNASGFRNLEHIIEVYVTSVHELQSARKDAQALFDQVCETNFELRCAGSVQAVARDAIPREELARLQREIRLPSAPVDRTLSADLANLDLGTATRELGRALRQQTRSFVRQFMATFETAVARDVVGRIDWRKKDEACVLDYRSRVVIAEGTKESKRQKKQRKRLEEHGFVQVTTKTTLTSRTGYEVRHVQHNQHLISVKRHPLERCPLPIPGSHEPLVRAVPCWLRPFVEIIDGRRIREQIVERTTRQGTHSSAKTEVCEQVVYVGDPALILGSFVLSGWGPGDHTQPNAARSDATERAGADLRFTPGVVLVLMAFMVGCILATGAVAGLILWVIGVLSVLAHLAPQLDGSLITRRNAGWGVLMIMSLGAVIFGMGKTMLTGQHLGALGAVFSSLVALYGAHRFLPANGTKSL